MSLFRRSMLAAALVFALVPRAAAGCNDDNTPPDQGCSDDTECGDGLHCANNGNCVACTDADHCAAGELCCDGACIADGEQENVCGCDADPNGSAGSTCDPLRSKICG